MIRQIDQHSSPHNIRLIYDVVTYLVLSGTMSPNYDSTKLSKIQRPLIFD